MNGLTDGEIIAVMKTRPCKNCGACCRGFAIELTHRDIEREPRLKKYAVAQENIKENKKKRLKPTPFAMLLKNGRCQFLTNQSKCSIHPTRPDTCRNYLPSFFVCHVSRLEERGLDCMGALTEFNYPFHVVITILLSINPKIIPPIGDQRGVNPRKISLVGLVNESYLQKQIKKALKRKRGRK